jgi:hypothetical protein
LLLSGSSIFFQAPTSAMTTLASRKAFSICLDWALRGIYYDERADAAEKERVELSSAKLTPPAEFFESRKEGLG